MEKLAQDKLRFETQAEEARLQAHAKIEREKQEREANIRAQELKIESERPKTTRQVPRWSIINPELLPKEFWKIDDVKIGTAIRAGARDIPGVVITMETIAVIR